MVRCRSSDPGSPISTTSSDKPRIRRPSRPQSRAEGARGRVAVELYANDPAALQAALATLGATNVRAQGPLVSAQVPVRALGDLAALPSLRSAQPVLASAPRRLAGIRRQPGRRQPRQRQRSRDRPRRRHRRHGRRAVRQLPVQPAGVRSRRADHDRCPGRGHRGCPAGVQVLSNGPCPASRRRPRHGAARPRRRAGRRAEVPHRLQRPGRLRRRHPAAAASRLERDRRRRHLLRREHVLRRHHRAGGRPRRRARRRLFLVRRQRRAAVLRVGVPRDERVDPLAAAISTATAGRSCCRCTISIPAPAPTRCRRST